MVATWVQPANAALLVEELRPYREQINEIVYEAGPTGCTLARILREEGLDGSEQTGLDGMLYKTKTYDACCHTDRS